MTLTTTDVSKTVKKQFGKEVPIWSLRRVFDALESSGVINIQRIGFYRLVDESDLPKIVAELQRRGYIPEAVASC